MRSSALGDGLLAPDADVVDALEHDDVRDAGLGEDVAVEPRQRADARRRRTARGCRRCPR